MSLRLAPGLAATLASQLVGAYPEEGCGVLVGVERAGVREVRALVGVTNRREDSRHDRYLIAPEQLLAAEKSARQAGLDVLGFYHSHPDHPAEPSRFDLEHAWPHYSYLIVAVAGGRVTDARSWRLTDDRSRFDPEPVAGAREPDASRATVSPGERR